MKYLSSSLSLLLSATLLVSCASNSDDETIDNNAGGSSTTVAATGVLVDPFVEGAILCEDRNKNSLCESDEQLSSSTDSGGKFSFESELTPGSYIIIKQQGFHNNVPYTLPLSGVVDSDGEIDVVSPLTTLQTKELSAEDIRSLLTNAGLSNLSDDDIFANPLEGGIDALDSDEKLKRLHASLATYGMLKVLKDSHRLSELSSTELLNSPEVNQILTVMVSSIKEALSRSSIDSFQAQADSFNNSLFTAPPVSVNVVAKTAVAVIDTLTKTGYDTCNQTDGTDAQKIAAALQAINSAKATLNSKIADIGMQYYAQENRAIFQAIPAAFQSSLPLSIRTGMAMDPDQAIVLSADADVKIQSKDVANFIMQAYADKEKPAITVTQTTCTTIQEDQPNFQAGLDCDNDGGKVAFATPRHFKVAYKSIGVINSSGEKKYLFKRDSLADSVVFDLTDPKVMGEMTVPQGTYVSVFAEVYYYWLDLEMYNTNQYTQFRVYMSDDNRSEATAGHHQGDITLTDANNSETGWLDAGGKWLLTDAVATRVEPQDPDQPLYAASKDADTSRQRGPFGNDDLWNNESLNPNDIFTPVQAISLTVTKESKIELTFSVKNNWYFEDYNGDSIFGPAEHKNSDTNITEAADANATWAPLLGLPTLTKIY